MYFNGINITLRHTRLITKAESDRHGARPLPPDLGEFTEEAVRHAGDHVYANVSARHGDAFWIDFRGVNGEAAFWSACRVSTQSPDNQRIAP